MQDAEICLSIDEAMALANISRNTARAVPTGRWSPFRISPEPFFVDRLTAERLETLGPWLRDFYHAADRLYHLSANGDAPAFVAGHLDAGKPDWLVRVARAESFREQIPVIIRPDLLFTNTGLRATELDSVPGSMGLLAFLEETYARLGCPLMGRQPTAEAFLQALQSLPGEDGMTAIVISDECASYRLETAWLAERWQDQGDNSPVVVRPEELQYSEAGVSYNGVRVTRVYRFFELFDWQNVDGAHALLHLAASGRVALTPPPKHYLEEKMWFAFLHDPLLSAYWQKLLSEEVLTGLQQLFPPTWLVAPDRTSPLGDWQRLRQTSRRERPFVLKPSGFSALAWGGHGFSRGKDYTTGNWAETIAQLLSQSDQSPFVLQSYAHSLPRQVSFYDVPTAAIQQFSGKTRLCPYYFLHLHKRSFAEQEDVSLSGALATTVPMQKPVIHGMTEAVMAPTAIMRDCSIYVP